MKVDTEARRLLGAGIYTFSEASQLLHVPAGTLRRWLRGYRFHARDGKQRTQRPVFERDFPDLPGGGSAISFLDLVEAMFIRAFLEHGVSWNHIRESAYKAAAEFETNHPFCVRRFATDGRKIFATIIDPSNEEDEHLVELVSRQAVFQAVVGPLLKSLDYDEAGAHESLRWWPLGRRSPVVVDPARSRGVPITDKSGVPTHIIHAAVEAEGGNVLRVARWYEIDEREVEAAVEFERRAA